MARGQKSKRPKKVGPEPEGGPEARKQEFLEERLTRLRPRGAEEPESGAAPERFGPESGPDFRTQAIAGYRARQREQAKRNPEKPGRRRKKDADSDPEIEEDGGNPGSGGEPPMPPAPPPANNWIPIGPSVVRKGQGGTLPAVSGRVLGFAVASGGNTVYLASSNGGVWRTDDAGASWRSLMDAWDLNPTNLASDSLSCGAIAIDPTNPQRVFVGTGDGDEAMFLGVGPVVSPDGGQNWTTEPVAPGSPALAGSAFNALAVDPGNTDRVVAGAFPGLYRREPAAGGTFHWARKATPAGVITSVVVARTGGITTFFAAPSSGPVYSSPDGNTWTVVGTGFPAANVGRVALAVQATNPNVLYALVAASNGSVLGVYRLDNAGGSWRQVTGAPADLTGTVAIGYQGTYDLAIAVDPNNSNLIFIGGSTKLSNGEYSGCSYRCAITGAGAGGTLTYSMTPTFVGNSHHADVHAIVFAPGDSNKLWMGCDGGAFYSTNPTAAGDIFTPRNTGLQTLEMNHLSQHPTEDAILFCGTQDNGGVRYTGEEAWYHSVWGDSGYFVVNWNDPYRILATYWGLSVNRTTNGGTRYSYASVSVPSVAGDSALFYAPLVGTPPSGTPAQAERVAFGTRRPWISDTFGGGWTSIPSNTATDDLGAQIRSMVFASFTRLYAATMGGRVYRLDQGGGGAWTSTRIDNVGGANVLGLAGPITGIAVDPGDATGASIYVCFGGNGDYRHVWHFNGTQWAQRSGPAAGNLASLLDVQHNAIVCDPANPATVFVGADIGVWRSQDGGQNWAPFSSGLPDAGVLDLVLHGPRRLLRASTYGRSVFEYRLDAANLAGVELYVRDTQLDQGRFTTVDWLPDPTAQGQVVRHWAGPDIKLDTPDAGGNYQFPTTAGTTIDFEQFTDELTDDSQNVATHATANITTRVYVQVHNRGVTPASGVRVMLLLANASLGLPNLPAGYATNVQNGTPITTTDWRTIGFATLNDVRVGFPKIAAFNLTSNLLPPPANLAGNEHHCVLALVHHPSDQFTATQTVTDQLSLGERKTAHKNLHVVQFTGTVPPAHEPPAVIVMRVNGVGEKAAKTSLVMNLNGYPGRVRIHAPDLGEDLEAKLEGFKPGKDTGEFKRWALAHFEAIAKNRESETPYDREWAEQRIADVKKAVDSDVVLVAEGRQERVAVHELVIKPGTWKTLFLLFDRPRGAKVGASYPIEILQVDGRTEQVVGGLTARIEVVPRPRKIDLRNFRLRELIRVGR
jgi:hypothetical protein